MESKKSPRKNIIRQCLNCYFWNPDDGFMRDGQWGACESFLFLQWMKERELYTKEEFKCKFFKRL